MTERLKIRLGPSGRRRVLPWNPDFSNLTEGGGLPSLQPAPAIAGAVEDLATGDVEVVDVVPDDEDLDLDRYYQFVVTVVLRGAVSGDYLRASALIDARRLAGTMATIGDQTDLPGGDATGITLVLTDAAEALRVELENDTGETVSGYIWVGWIGSLLPA